jgi:hypothetical protein
MARRVGSRVISAINGVDVAKIGLRLPRCDGDSLNFETGAPAATDRRAKDAMRGYSPAWQGCCDNISAPSVGVQSKLSRALASNDKQEASNKQEQE